MAVTNGWGQGVDNTIEWGKGSTNNSNDWGSIYGSSAAGDTLLSAASFSNTNSTEYDGVDDYVEVTPYASLDGATSFSISFWIKPTASVVRSCFFIDGTTDIHFIYRGNSGAEYIDMSLNSTSNYARSSAGSVPLNQWTHIIWTYDGSQSRYSRYKLYINGQSDLDSNSGSTISSLGTFTKLWIGKQNSNEWTGFFDEFAIYKNTILTQPNAELIYNLGVPNDLNNNGLAAPTNWWRFEEGSGTTAIDSGSGGNNGTLVNGTAYSADVPPTFNKFALSFDGVDDFVSMGNVLNMANDGTDAFSVSFWIKRNSFSFEMIVSKQLNSGSYNGFGVYINSGKLNFLLGSLLSPSSSIQGKSTSSVVGSTWQNITLTYDGSQDISGFNIYINGVSDTIVQVSNTTPTNVANTTNFQLSGRDGTSLKYGGLLDEVGFWLGTELTSVQASAIYNIGNPASLSAYSPTSYWRFEEGSGTTATDSGSASNNGTLTNGVAYSTDKP